MSEVGKPLFLPRTSYFQPPTRIMLRITRGSLKDSRESFPEAGN